MTLEVERQSASRRQLSLALALLAYTGLVNVVAFASVFLAFLTVPDSGDGTAHGWHARAWMLGGKVAAYPILVFAAVQFALLVRRAISNQAVALALTIPVAFGPVARLLNIGRSAWMLANFDDLREGYAHVLQAVPWLALVTVWPPFLSDLSMAVGVLILTQRFAPSRTWLPHLAIAVLVLDNLITFTTRYWPDWFSAQFANQFLAAAFPVLSLGSVGVLIAAIAFGGARGNVSSNRE